MFNKKLEHFFTPDLIFSRISLNLSNLPLLLPWNLAGVSGSQGTFLSLVKATLNSM